MKGCRPCNAWMSEPQMPAATVRTNASPGIGAGTTRCTPPRGPPRRRRGASSSRPRRSERPAPQRQATADRTSMADQEGGRTSLRCRRRRSPASRRRSRWRRSAWPEWHRRPGSRLRRPLLGLQPAVDKRLGLSLQFAADQRFESGANLRADVAGAHGEPNTSPITSVTSKPGRSFIVETIMRALHLNTESRSRRMLGG